MPCVVRSQCHPAHDLPKVSVLMPVWNGAACVSDTLESLLAQSFTDFEIIAVDDGSTDQTLSILQAYAAKDARVRPISVAHGGIVHALNAGLSHARGDYVARMDADDFCHPDRLALQVAYLDEHPETGLVASRVSFGGDAETCHGFMHYINWSNGLLSHADMFAARFRESPLVHPTVMFRRTLVDLHGPYAEGPFPEDYELWLRFFAAGVRMAKLPQNLVTWNDPPNRLTRTHDNYSDDAFASLRARYLAAHLHTQISPSQACGQTTEHTPAQTCGQNAGQAREVYILGAGRMARRRARHLLDHGVAIAAWIDIDPKKVGNIVEGRRVLSLDQMPPPKTAMFVAYLAQHGASDELVSVLAVRGYVQGVDFILAS
ncbi:MAG: glycosyltransferase [Pseudomonadota bacterium]